MPKPGNHFCRVCGLYYDDPPWGANGRLPSFDICLCCGVEFGYGDSILEAIRSWRSEWVARGAPWRWPDADTDEPSDRNLVEQMKNIPAEFL